MSEPRDRVGATRPLRAPSRLGAVLGALAVLLALLVLPALHPAHTIVALQAAALPAAWIWRGMRRS